MAETPEGASRRSRGFSLLARAWRGVTKLFLLESGEEMRCVGRVVDENNVCTWYDSEWGCVVRAPSGLPPRPTSIDLALVTSTDNGAYMAHTQP